MLMPFRASSSTSTLEKTVCRSIALLLILAAAALQILYWLWDCPVDLAPDEAHYWDWSRHLDWSYYSKGPLVAWLIRASWVILGPLAEPSVTATLAVRLPAVVCGSLLLASVYVLCVQVYRSERFALLMTSLALTLPLIAAAFSFMTIDSPYVCCWGWALVLGHRALFRGSGWAWPLLGLVIGIGILAKYTMVLWIPSLVLFLLTSREHRPLLWAKGPWIMGIVAALCCTPILIWNWQHDWITVRHVFGLAGVQKPSTSIHWLGPLVYFGGQFAVLFGYWFVVWICAMIVHRPWRESNAEMRYLWWLSAGTFLLFLAFSFKTGGGYLNWPVTAYLSGLVLAAGWLMQQLCSPVTWYRRLAVGLLITFGTLGLVTTVLMHQAHWTRALLTPIVGAPTAERPFPLRRFDPTCRLRGWRALAREVDQVRDELRAQGVEPILMGTRWTDCGELGFYCKGHPTVYCLGPVQGDRQSQYDLWRPNPIADPEQFEGRTFVLVGAPTAEARDLAFAGPTEVRTFIYREDDQPIAAWQICVCRGFRGFVKLPKLRHY